MYIRTWLRRNNHSTTVWRTEDVHCDVPCVCHSSKGVAETPPHSAPSTLHDIVLSTASVLLKASDLKASNLKASNLKASDLKPQTSNPPTSKPQTSNLKASNLTSNLRSTSNLKSEPQTSNPSLKPQMDLRLDLRLARPARTI